MSARVRYTLGFSDSVHDRSVCLFRDGQPIVAIEEERLTRQKHAVDFGGHSLRDADVFRKLRLDEGASQQHESALASSVQYCLNAVDITLDDVELIIGSSLHIAFPFSDRAVYLNHHLAHAASAYYGSAASNAAILVIDGYGDATSADSYETVSLYEGKTGSLRRISAMSGTAVGSHIGNSVGILYRIGTLLAGFGVLDEGKLMGLSAYGEPRFVAQIEKHVCYEQNGVTIACEHIWQSFQGQVPPDDDFRARADIASSFQTVLERIVLHYVRIARSAVKSQTLCLAGGAALNCVANQKVVDSELFEDVFVFPGAADNGISFGAAYYGSRALLALPGTSRLEHMFWGRPYGRSEVLAALQNAPVALHYEELTPDRKIAKAAALLARGEVLMWFQGGAELGPRALGNRSILASPRSTATRDYINHSVKFREGFRPLAPMVPVEVAERYFHLRGESAFMLLSPRCKAETLAVAPAIVHQDGSARAQTVSASAQPVVHALLLEMGRLTGCPILLNTSFNVQGEPIVETPGDAIRSFAAAPVEYLFVNDFAVTKLARS